METVDQTTPQMHVVCHCGKTIKFGGSFSPLICTTCSTLLPDLFDLVNTTLERVVYHLDKELFI